MSYPIQPALQSGLVPGMNVASVSNTIEQSSVLFDLKQTIETLANDLRQYALKENASQYYIDWQNKIITTLVAVYNNIEGVQLLHFWQSVEQEMQRISSVDAQVSGYTISIRTRPTGDIFSLIQINSFSK
jgi:hypothetical protein